MDNQKQTVAEAVKAANNVLVTVSANPSVDQLAACIGLTLSLNKMGKHATAVFSGAVPSTIEFLQPEKTLEKNTDSLRDFIISLDKSKADKLRYKVEDRVVKIFITPYKTSIGEHDLEFSQGDFNVDVVLALGVHVQADLDQAITSHGRILHDAKVITLNNKPGGELGGINWLEASSSSLSELASELVFGLDKTLLDPQIATALLTGIVAETERFSNSLTSPQTMSISAELMAAGANQQLVATKLQAPEPPTPATGLAGDGPTGGTAVPAKAAQDGTLEITHDTHKDAKEAATASDGSAPAVYDPEYKDKDLSAQDEATTSAPEPEPAALEKPSESEGVEATPPPPDATPTDTETLPAPQIAINEDGTLDMPDGAASSDDEGHTPEERAILDKPKKRKGVHKNDRPYLGNPNRRTEDDKALLGMPDVASETAVAAPDIVSTKDPLTLPDLDMPLLDRQPLQSTATQVNADEPAAKVDDTETLSDIEKELHSSHASGITNYETLESDPVTGSASVGGGGGLSLPDADTEPSAPTPAETSDSTAPSAPISQDEVTPAAASTGQPEATPEPTAEADAVNVTDARSAVEQAINAMAATADQPQHPIQALNAQQMHDSGEIKGSTGIVIVPPGPDNQSGQPVGSDGAPPPIPPPLMPPFSGK